MSRASKRAASGTKTAGMPQKHRKRLRRRVATPTAARRVSATDAARSFSDLLNRVQYRGETVVVERGGAPVCEITPAKPLVFSLAELAAFLRTGAKADRAYWDLIEKITRHQPLVDPSPWER